MIRESLILIIFVMILSTLMSGCLSMEKEEEDIYADYVITDPTTEIGKLPIDNEWERDETRNVIFKFANMYQPNVIYDKKSRYPYKMWFFGWASEDTNQKYPGCDAIFHARSMDMNVWEVYSGEDKWDTTMNPRLWVPVIVPSDKYYDDWHNGDPSVVKKDGKYYMAYSAYGKDVDGLGSWEKGDTDGDIACVMGAVSDDGIKWTKTSAPLLVWEDEIGKDERPGRSSGEHFGDYHRPSLMWDEGKWKLWFDYWAGPSSGISMGYAENTGDFSDTGSWKVIRAGTEPLINEWPNPDVVKVGSLYYSFADPHVRVHGAALEDAPWSGWAARQLAYAVSKDGLDWTVQAWIAPDSDSAANHVPQIFIHKDTMYLWYATQIGGEPYDYRYDNIRYMTKKLK